MIKKLNTETSPLTNKQRHLAKVLVDQKMEKSSFETIPEYEYSQLKKGITCKYCSKFMQLYSRSKLKCKGCDSKQSTDSSVIRNIKEFSLLFPHKKITVNNIYLWCDMIISKKVIRRILQQNLKLVNKTRYSYYVPIK